MNHALTLPSYPLYMLLHPAYAASLRTAPVHGKRFPPTPKTTSLSSGHQGSGKEPTPPKNS